MIGCYLRVATEKQLNEPKRKTEKDNANSVKTIVFFNDGTSRELMPSEIRSIFEGFLNGQRGFSIAKPKKQFDYLGKLKYMEVNDGESNHICKKHL